ncbi:TPA: LysR family transcriptional regulator, partial [Acinetobacter baumannii]|nr:LysR family transcriptional regulator [Acinetobacter baumannii]
PRHFAKHIDKEHNVLIDLKDEAIHKTVGIVYKKNFEISNISAQFIEALVQYKF